MQTATVRELDSVQSQRDELHAQLQGLAGSEQALGLEREAVEARAAELEARIRELASQEAELQQRKKQLQEQAKQIGQERSAYIAKAKEIQKQRQAIDGQLARLDHTEQQVHNDLVEEARMREQLRAQDEAWRAQQEAARRAEAEAAERRRRALADEKRRSPRIAVAVDVSLQTEHNFFMGLTENLSEGGLFIATYEPLPLGTELDLTLNLPDLAPIQARCAVRWVREHTPFTEDMAPGVGVQFLDLDAVQQAAIRGFLQQRDPILFEVV